ncbi:MAG: prolipoprotein diacylglyceryl transferase [Phycisphaerae bacterium]
MKPVLFTIPGINWDVPGYGVMLMLGLFVSIWWAARRAMKSGANPDVILNCGFIALIAGVLGCRVMYVVHYWDQYAGRGLLGTVIAIIDIRKGGLEFYGGFTLTMVVTLAWLRWREKVSLRWYLDIIAPSAGLGLAIGRIGCFLNGCCFGSTCDLPWAVRFPFGSNAASHQWNEKMPGAALREELLYAHAPGLVTPLLREFLYTSDEHIEGAVAAEAAARQELDTCKAELAVIDDPTQQRELRAKQAKLERKLRKAESKFPLVRANMKKYGLSVAELRAMADASRALPVHPAQPYSTVTALLIALFLNALYWRRTRDGQVICTLLLVEPVSRWLLEVIRADNPIDTVGVFTISQFLALCMTLAGLIGLLVLRRMPPRSPRAKIWQPPEEQSREKAAKNKAAAAAG